MESRRRVLGVSRSRRSEAGLTLVELLVVMAILALATSVVVFSAPPARNPARVAAEDFTSSLQAAIDDAVISGGVFRLRIGVSEWAIERLDDGDWRPVYAMDAEDDRTAYVSVSVKIEEAAASNAASLYGGRGRETGTRPRNGEAPVIIPIDPFGDTPGFTASFQSDGATWLVHNLADGGMKVERQ